MIVQLLDSFFGITCSAPHNSVWWYSAIILIGLIVWGVYRQRELVFRIVDVRHIRLILINYSFKKQMVKSIFTVVSLIFLLLALLRPQWDQKEESVVRQGRDIIIALDVSRSMLAQDFQPSRLAYAKEKIQKLVAELQAERFGLLIFSGAAALQCPLTTDYEAFSMFLRDLSVETISSGTTSIDAALQKVLEVYGQSSNDSHTRLVALFTDGEDFSHDKSAVRQKILDSNISLFTLGIGSVQGAPIPLYDKRGVFVGYQKDKDGTVVISCLNDRLMKQIAQETGGKYLRSTSDDTDIMAIKNWVDTFEKQTFEDRSVQRLQDKYQYYSFFAFLVLVVEWLL